MKKKKENNLKGFTLIELLAVIVILAIIALIAVPQVLKILNKARLSATEDSVYGIVKSAETYVSNFMLKNRGALPNENLIFDCNGTSCNLTTSLTGYELEGLDTLEFKGTKPKSGKVTISNSGSNIVITDLVINNFVCGYIGGQSTCIEKGKIETKENGTVIYFNPETNEQCSNYVETNSDTENKAGCMKWYVFNDSENSAFYNLILDHNTTSKIDNWNNRNIQLSNDTSSWNSNLNSRLITANEIATITNKKDFNADDSLTWYYFDTMTKTRPSPYPQPSQYGWLLDRINDDCEKYGCLNNATGDNINNMWGYWTDTACGEDRAWRIDPLGGINVLAIDINPIRGVRPVITVPKNKIL